MSFATVRGEDWRIRSRMVAEHVFTEGVPTPGRETIQFLFYVVASDTAQQAKDEEVVIDKFEYLP